MERLTIKNSDGTYSQPTHTTFEKMFNKLAEFEDFMEEQGFERLEEIKSTLFVLEVTFKTNNRLVVQNAKLKDRWENLKVWVEDIEKKDFVITITPQAILNKMQELEENMNQ